MNIAQILMDSALRNPDKTFVIFEDEKISYGRFSEKALRLANGLRNMGVETGDRVLVYGHNSLNWLVAEFGLFSSGAVLVTISPQYTAPEIEYIVDHCEAETILFDSALSNNVAEVRDKLPNLKNFISFGDSPVKDAVTMDGLINDHEPLWAPVHRKGEEVAVLLYTSGTTGKPKGVVIQLNGLNWASATFARAWFKPDDIVLIMLPLTYGFASLVELVPSIRIGATCVVLPRFHPELVLKAIEKHKVTLIEGVPTMYAMVHSYQDADKYDLSSLRSVISAGSVLSYEFAQNFKEKFGVPIIDYYSLTEAAPLTSYDLNVVKESKPNSCGRPFPGVDLRVVDSQDNDVPVGELGEIIARAPAMLKEYYKNPEATAETLKNGWLHTGDVGRMDEEGYLYIADRKKDMIIRGGANIYPAEIEDVLYSHPKVAEAAVVGHPDPIFGEQVRAVLTVKPGETLTAEEIVELCRHNLAEYKIPKYIEFWAELPKGTTNKILKRNIRETPLQQGA